MNSPYFFGTIAESLSSDGKRYSVMTNWGQRVEASHYRGETFSVGNRVFLEKAEGDVWMIDCSVMAAP